DEPLLGLRQAPAETIERIDREDRRLLLVVRVEMCPMMLAAGFHKHPDHDPEEAREFRHVRTLASSELPCRANVPNAPHDRSEHPSGKPRRPGPFSQLSLECQLLMRGARRSQTTQPSALHTLVGSDSHRPTSPREGDSPR